MSILIRHKMYWKVPLETRSVCLNLLSEYDVQTRRHQQPFLVKRLQDLGARTWPRLGLDSNKIANEEALSMTFYLPLITCNNTHCFRIRCFLLCIKWESVLWLPTQEAMSAETTLWAFGAIFSKIQSEFVWPISKRGGAMGYQWTQVDV